VLDSRQQKGGYLSTVEKENEKLENLRRDRLLFYSGILLALVGGPGFLMMSWLHDVLKVPIIGNGYHIFGPVNVSFTLLGLIPMVFGLILLGISLRGGLVPNQEAETRPGREQE